MQLFSKLLTAVLRSGTEERGRGNALAKVGSAVKQTLGRIKLLLQLGSFLGHSNKQMWTENSLAELCQAQVL